MMDTYGEMRACHEACKRAGLSPATLAADPDCIKRVVEVALSAQCGCSVAERDSGHLVGCWKPALDEARAAIGKEPA